MIRLFDRVSSEHRFAVDRVRWTEALVSCIGSREAGDLRTPSSACRARISPSNTTRKTLPLHQSVVASLLHSLSLWPQPLHYLRSPPLLLNPTSSFHRLLIVLSSSFRAPGYKCEHLVLSSSLR
jgi:hypothetical protein